MKKIVLWVFVALWLVFIFMMSGMTSSKSNNLSREVVVDATKTKVQGKSFDDLNKLVRKCAHATEYCVLAILLMLAVSSTFNISGKRLASIVILLCFLYAGSDEWHQAFVPGRTSSIVDVLIDTLGAIFATIIYLLISVKSHQKC